MKINNKKKISKIIILLFMIIIIKSITFSDQFYNKINITGENKYKEFYLTEEIYKNSANSLEDIRIINSKNEAVPYVLEISKGNTNTYIKESYFSSDIKTIEKSDVKEIIIKFEPNDKNIDILANKLEIKSNKNFYIEYQLYGSNNGTKWDFIAKGDMYSTPRDSKLSLKFREDYYEYYKFQIPTTEEVSITGAILSNEIELTENIKPIVANLEFEDITKEIIEKKENNHETYIQIKINKVPIKSISLVIQDDYFDRNYFVVDKSIDYIEKRVYDYISVGKIFRTSIRENLIINLNFIISDEILLIISNTDNRPIKITEINGNYLLDKIIFLCEDLKDTYKITYGDESRFKQNYDIEKYYKEIKEKDMVTLDKSEKNAIASELRKDEEGKKDKNKEGKENIFYKLFLGLISVILIIYVAKSLKKSKK
ncbi:MAG: hypothetical protein LBT51_01050 [Fusobacteriaceae bacterium]|jgi:hypothetical protein|nr:hypothetical protein [Fusobacteriaceae bacterium]